MERGVRTNNTHTKEGTVLVCLGCQNKTPRLGSHNQGVAFLACHDVPPRLLLGTRRERKHQSSGIRPQPQDLITSIEAHLQIQSHWEVRASNYGMGGVRGGATYIQSVRHYKFILNFANVQNPTNIPHVALSG